MKIPCVQSFLEYPARLLDTPPRPPHTPKLGIIVQIQIRPNPTKFKQKFPSCLSVMLVNPHLSLLSLHCVLYCIMLAKLLSSSEFNSERSSRRNHCGTSTTEISNATEAPTVLWHCWWRHWTIVEEQHEVDRHLQCVKEARDMMNGVQQDIGRDTPCHHSPSGHWKYILHQTDKLLCDNGSCSYPLPLWSSSKLTVKEWCDSVRTYGQVRPPGQCGTMWSLLGSNAITVNIFVSD